MSRRKTQPLAPTPTDLERDWAIFKAFESGTPIPATFKDPVTGNDLPTLPTPPAITPTNSGKKWTQKRRENQFIKRFWNFCVVSSPWLIQTHKWHMGPRHLQQPTPFQNWALRHKTRLLSWDDDKRYIYPLFDTPKTFTTPPGSYYANVTLTHRPYVRPRFARYALTHKPLPIFAIHDGKVQGYKTAKRLDYPYRQHTDLYPPVLCLLSLAQYNSYEEWHSNHRSNFTDQEFEDCMSSGMQFALQLLKWSPP